MRSNAHSNVRIGSPITGDDALVTAMAVGRYHYATTIMLALESEACQLLAHVARDNRKRKRGSSVVRVPCPLIRNGVSYKTLRSQNSF